MFLVINLKKNSKQNNFPFANEVKEMKDNFKRMIDSMPDDDFIDFIEYINFCLDNFDEDFDEDYCVGDEGWEDEAAKFYGYNPDEIVEDDTLPF